MRNLFGTDERLLTKQLITTNNHMLHGHSFAFVFFKGAESFLRSVLN